MLFENCWAWGLRLKGSVPRRMLLNVGIPDHVVVAILDALAIG